jgi:hypothetical protein
MLMKMRKMRNENKSTKYCARLRTFFVFGEIGNCEIVFSEHGVPGWVFSLINTMKPSSLPI